MAEHSFDFLEHTAPLWERGGARAEAAATALRTLCRNPLVKPSQLNFRRVKASAPGFVAKVASVPGALDVLERSGWSKVAYPDGP